MLGETSRAWYRLMFLSVFDMFKIGIGPSSSHTVGPMVAARRFLETAAGASLPRTGRLTVTLHGSLAFTGKGHGTDRAVVLGLAGETPQSMDPDRVEEVLRHMAERGQVAIAPGHLAGFNPARDVIFDFGPALKGHAPCRNLFLDRRRLRPDRGRARRIPCRGQAGSIIG